MLHLSHRGERKTPQQVVRINGAEVYRGEPLSFHQFQLQDGKQSRTLRLACKHFDVIETNTWSIEVDSRELLRFTTFDVQSAHPADTATRDPLPG